MENEKEVIDKSYEIANKFEKLIFSQQHRFKFN